MIFLMTPNVIHMDSIVVRFMFWPFQLDLSFSVIEGVEFMHRNASIAFPSEAKFQEDKRKQKKIGRRAVNEASLRMIDVSHRRLAGYRLFAGELVNITFPPNMCYRRSQV